MAGHPHPAELVTQLAMDTGSVGEYLTHEVLSRLPEDARTVLIRTGFLGEVGAQQAAFVSGIDTAGQTLDELSTANSFVVAIDRERTTYHYHQLLAEILHLLMRREPIGERAAVVERAVDWSVRIGRLDEAIRVTLEFEEWSQAAAVLIDGGFLTAFVARTDLELARRALSAHPADDSVSALALAALHVRIDPARARFYLGKVDAAELGRHPHGPRTRRLVELLLARSEHRQDAVEVIAADLVDRSGDEETPLGFSAAVMIERARGLYWSGQHREVEAALVEARRRAHDDGQPQLELECATFLSLACAFWGRVEASRAYELEATRLVRQVGELSAPADLHLAAALRCFMRAD